MNRSGVLIRRSITLALVASAVLSLLTGPWPSGPAAVVLDLRRPPTAGSGTPAPPVVRDGEVRDLGLPIAQMLARARTDLRDLTLPSGAALAAWSPAWRYVWPRDASFVAAALAGTGDRARAQLILDFLQRVQERDGQFQARYLPDGSGPPDRRGHQSDGPAWALWATARLMALTPVDQRHEVASRYAALIDRSSRRLLAETRAGHQLPAPSPDYWEVPEHRTTLGVAGAMLIGLTASSELARWVSSGTHTAGAAEVNRYRSVLVAAYGPGGYQRYAGAGGPDAAISFLMPGWLPPLDPVAPAVRSPASGHDASAITSAWLTTQGALRRPAGGLAPGAAWRHDGISWTPETALFAYSAAGAGDRAVARAWLGWLAAHTTQGASLPEKVSASGAPGSVAPLAWTAALVVLTAEQLAEPRRIP